MSDSEIVKTYSDTALEGIVRQLSRSGQWRERLEAAARQLSVDNHSPTHIQNMTSANTQLAVPQRVSALSIMGNRLKVDPAKLMQTLKATVFKNATDDELLALVVVSNEYGLNPLTKEIYAFPAKGGGIVPVVSIDGWVSMVNDHPAMDGMEFEERYDDAGKLEAITCKLWRKDRNRPISVTEHLSECKRNTDPWKMEHRMLRHKALMQCARYAFGFSGVTDEDEASDTPGMRDVTPARATAPRLPASNPYEDAADPVSVSEEAPEADEIPATGENPNDSSEARGFVNEADERASLIADIKAMLKELDSTLGDFGSACRTSGLIHGTATIRDIPISALRHIHDNRLTILKGEYQAGGEA